MVSIGVKGDLSEGFVPEMIAAGLYEGESPEGLGEAAAEVFARGDFTGKTGETSLLYGQEDLASSRLLLVGLGERERFGREGLRRYAATVARRARSLRLGEAALTLPIPSGGEARDAARIVAEGAGLGLYRFVRYKTATEDRDPERLWIVADDESLEEAARGSEVGEKTAAAAALARDLANEPSNVATPEYLAQTARGIAGKYAMGLTVLDRAGIAEAGLTGLATVGRSASNEPRFIVVEHRRGGEAAPVVLVGKAVTFDSGGISIKPSAGMEEMKFDMSGGAAVLGAMEAVGSLDLALNVVALVPATENLPGGDAFKPGDVLEMHSGKTVEIITTDAEGRLILADALSYARRYEPAAVVDCATLTGACYVALGDHASGLMGNDEDLLTEVRSAGERAGERAWPLPLFEEYTEQIKGDAADIKNSGGRYGGALTAGAFLKEFADYPWAHLDIAGTAYVKRGDTYTPKGATGAPTRLLVEFLRGRAEGGA